MTADVAGSGNPAESLAVLGARPLGPQDPVMVGRYRIHALLGVGGMGRVYLAWAQRPGFAPGRSGAWVAVKVVRPDLADNPEFRRRFARELEAVGRVRTPYAAALVHGEPDARQPWMATEFVPGVALADAAGPDGALPASSVWRLAHDLAGALAAVHQAGIVHRDVKPSNVILGSVGAKIIDFGVAHASDLSQLTATGMNIGTPSYMAPEQAKSGEVSPASDMFSLGVLLYFAATGRLPFGEGGTAEVLFRVVYEEPDLSGLDGLEPGLRELIRRCMAKMPLQRPNAAGVVALAEDAAVAGLWDAQEEAAWPVALAERISERTRAAGRTLPDPSLYPASQGQSVAEVPEAGYQAPEPSVLLPPVDSEPTLYTGSRESQTRGGGGRKRGVLIASISAAAVLGLGGAAYAVLSPVSHPSAVATSTSSTAGEAAADAGASGAAPDVHGPVAAAPASAAAATTAAVTSAPPSASASASASPDSSSHPAASSVATPTTPPPSTTTKAPVSATIANVNAGLCLSVTGASTAANATADVYTCNGSVSENWTINSNGTITGDNSGLCLSVSGNSAALKTTADINTCDGDSFEKWTVESNGTIVNGDGQCLSITGASTSPYTTADLYTCNGSVSENWSVR